MKSAGERLSKKGMELHRRNTEAALRKKGLERRQTGELVRVGRRGRRLASQVRSGGHRVRTGFNGRGLARRRWLARPIVEVAWTPTQAGAVSAGRGRYGSADDGAPLVAMVMAATSMRVLPSMHHPGALVVYEAAAATHL